MLAIEGINILADSIASRAPALLFSLDVFGVRTTDCVVLLKMSSGCRTVSDSYRLQGRTGLFRRTDGDARDAEYLRVQTSAYCEAELCFSAFTGSPPSYMRCVSRLNSAVKNTQPVWLSEIIIEGVTEYPILNTILFKHI